jgi:hypothetical protein
LDGILLYYKAMLEETHRFYTRAGCHRLYGGFCGKNCTTTPAPAAPNTRMETQGQVSNREEKWGRTGMSLQR